MADRKIVYLILERGMPPNKQTFWRNAGVAYECRDGSLNVKLDIHPGLTFNIRDPKSNGEHEENGQHEAEEENDRSFNCSDCKQLFPDEEAHLISGGGVVCVKCSDKYKLCESCDRLFPKTIRSKLCPTCK
jgi:RNA polymerase subunit RPABC4/transcription elongation factor Spt4